MSECNHKSKDHKDGVTCLLRGRNMGREQYAAYVLAKAGVSADEAVHAILEGTAEISIDRRTKQ